MSNRLRDFQVVGQPFPSGRVVGKTDKAPVDEKKAKQVPEELSSELLNIVKGSLLSLQPVPLPQGISKMPFNKLKTLAYLKAVEMYLRAQLVAVSEAKKELLEETE